ncbi:MAG: hypothetical protein L6R37_002349 [Teloschistes peruensis]|nr:MAG: hypothetical protein L6R37_002349 [Teloschistes peruensis]
MPYPAQATLCRHVVKSQRRFFLSVPALNTAHARGRSHAPQSRYYSAADLPSEPRDPRVKDLGRAIVDDFAMIRSTYQTPKNPVVLAHGLLGFDELHLAGPRLPGVHYWRGIAEAMRKNGVEVITTHVPASSSIEERAERLGEGIAEMAGGKSVNIIA